MTIANVKPVAQAGELFDRRMHRERDDWNHYHPKGAKP